MLDLTGQRQKNGYLEAVKSLGAKDKDKGIIWKCLCHFCEGANYRNVLTRDFTSGRIKKCNKCVSPVFRERQRRLVATNKQRQRDLGPPWYSDEFRRTWRDILAAFTPAQVLLFDTIMDGRTRWQWQMQAVDWVRRTHDIELELFYLGRERVLRNMTRAAEAHREKKRKRRKWLVALCPECKTNRMTRGAKRCGKCYRNYLYHNVIKPLHASAMHELSAEDRRRKAA